MGAERDCGLPGETWANRFHNLELTMNHITQIFTLATFTGISNAQITTIPAANQKQVQVIDESSTWTHLGGNTRRQSNAITSNAIPSLATPTWIADGHATTTYIPIPQTGLVVDHTQIYALSTNPDQPGSSFAVCYDRLTGSFKWATPIPPAILDSWSTPAIDTLHNQLIIAISDRLVALDTITGNENWSTPIDGIVVNASPIVTNDLGDADRAFITNYSFGGGTPAKLTCINTDPFHPINNPFQPGEIVWQQPTCGDSSGNSPAYTNGMIYVASASSSGSPAGQIQAFDATATTPPTPAWTFTNTINAGFFSGVSIAHGHIYASSYSFSGLQHSANTVKLNKLTGNLVWSVPTNRTDAMPIVLDNGEVIVSGGIATGIFDFLPFFGSLPSIQYITDTNNTPTVLWDSAIETLNDTNTNGVWDFGESFLSIGGWTHQPIALTINNTPMLLVGTHAQTTPGVQFAHNTDLQIIDLTQFPTDPEFITEQFTGAGSTPAMVHGWIYTTGETGIHAFAPTQPLTQPQLFHRYTQGQITIDQLVNQLQK